jgi:hypothetical protein
MTDTTQVKRLVQPLLDRHADLELVGRWIFVKPVRHFARGVIIDRTRDPAEFRPKWAVVHLFEVRRSFSLDWGEELDHDSRRWRLNDPGTSRALLDKIEQRALPPLRTMKSLDDYLAFVSDHFFRHQLFDWPDAKIIVDVALGDLDAARRTCEDHLQKWPLDNPAHDEDSRQKFRRLHELCARLRADNRPGLAQLLHEWEARTVRNLKIEHLWQPTPFPLEQKQQTMRR